MSNYQWNEAINELTSNVELVINDLYIYRNNDDVIMKYYGMATDKDCKMCVVSDSNKMYDVGEIILVKFYDLEKYNG